MSKTLEFYEFFAGGGMARAGLGAEWTCTFANDFDPKKCSSYVSNWGDEHLLPGDIGAVSTSDLPGRADLAWASSPCQDFSLAGLGAGLNGHKSNVFWSFWRLMVELAQEGRKPRAIVIENVKGMITSRGGVDFQTIVRALAIENYSVGGFVIDAKDFVPQSRPRLFVVGLLKNDTQLPASGEPNERWHPASLQKIVSEFPEYLKSNWHWWGLPNPPARNSALASLLEESPRWHSTVQTERLLKMMNSTNREKIESRKRLGTFAIGAAFRRTRIEQGRRCQRIEVRFDDVAGCLRTPGGGSSRQTIFRVGQNQVQSRLLSPRETARLMGLPDHYVLPANTNEALHLTGDGVAVPVVEFLSEHLLQPSLAYRVALRVG